jgi:superfamily I DNA/RNA helicase
MPLPSPRGRQKEVLALPSCGTFVVLGTAGSGKTTLAILRAAFLASPSAQHGGRTLLLTFNRTLVTYLRHLQEEALPGVSVENYHQFARGYLANRGLLPNGCICSPDQRDGLMRIAIGAIQRKSGPGLTMEQLDQEFRWIAQHGLGERRAYLSGGVFGASDLDEGARRWVFDAYEEYLRLRQAHGRLYDWDDIASAVRLAFLNDPTARRYRHIVIDEGQDFSPEMVRSLAAALPADGSLTLFGDVAQQIYGQRTSWRSAGLELDGTWTLCDNYRNTAEIARLGLAISALPWFSRVREELVEPVAPTAAGPPPLLVRCEDEDAEVRFVTTEAARGSNTQSVAVLLPRRADESRFAGWLTANGVRLDRDMARWPTGPRLCYGTYHAAKGLEFDTVILPFCGADSLPSTESIRMLGLEEARSYDAALLYVGAMRARTRLLITYSRHLSELLPSEPGLYQQVSI